MANIEAWNKLVSQYNKNIGKKEELIQSSWEFAFSTIFNFSDSEIVSQFPVKMGVETKRADILIRHNKEDLFVVELKKHSLSQQAGQAQLFSYLNQLKVDIGILVCDKLYIYDFDYTKKDENYSFVEIDFIQDNPDGEKFVELFMSDSFDKEKIKEFITNKNQSNNNIDLIRKELNPESVLQILKNHFSQKYPVEDVEKALAKYRIEICLKSEMPPQVPNEFVPIASDEVADLSFAKGKDFTQYSLNGIPSGGKGSTVHAAVKLYVNNHPDITFIQLQAVFPDDAARPGYNKMLRQIEKIEKKDKNRFKYFSLSDGTQVGVSSQWKPENMQSFIKYAERAGLDIKPIR